jgi:hypothetical protein
LLLSWLFFPLFLLVFDFDFDFAFDFDRLYLPDLDRERCPELADDDLDLDDDDDDDDDEDDDDDDDERDRRPRLPRPLLDPLLPRGGDLSELCPPDRCLFCRTGGDRLLLLLRLLDLDPLPSFFVPPARSSFIRSSSFRMSANSFLCSLSTALPGGGGGGGGGARCSLDFATFFDDSPALSAPLPPRPCRLSGIRSSASHCAAIGTAFEPFVAARRGDGERPLRFFTSSCSFTFKSSSALRSRVLTSHIAMMSSSTPPLQQLSDTDTTHGLSMAFSRSCCFCTHKSTSCSWDIFSRSAAL